LIAIPYFRDNIGDYISKTLWLKKLLYLIPTILHPYLGGPKYNGEMIFNLY
jgi:hypothetical protein